MGSPSPTPIIATDVEIEQTPRDVTVRDVPRARVHVLNTSAGRILRLCDGAHSRADMIDAFAADDVDRALVAKDVEAVLSRFSELGLIEDCGD